MAEHIDHVRVRLRPPRHGWCLLELEAGPRRVYSSFSRVPDDSLRQLVEAADAVATGPVARCVVLREEPAEVELQFGRAAADTAELVVVRYRDRRRGGERGELLADYTLPARELARAFWRAFRDLEGRCPGDAYEQHWHNPFPIRELENLGSHVRERG